MRLLEQGGTIVLFIWAMMTDVRAEGECLWITNQGNQCNVHQLNELNM